MPGFLENLQQQANQVRQSMQGMMANFRAQRESFWARGGLGLRGALDQRRLALQNGQGPFQKFLQQRAQMMQSSGPAAQGTIRDQIRQNIATGRFAAFQGQTPAVRPAPMPPPAVGPGLVGAGQQARSQPLYAEPTDEMIVGTARLPEKSTIDVEGDLLTGPGY
jgi:hypothetical protein